LWTNGFFLPLFKEEEAVFLFAGNNKPLILNYFLDWGDSHLLNPFLKFRKISAGRDICAVSLRGSAFFYFDYSLIMK